jgi:hypothetical protein
MALGALAIPLVGFLKSQPVYCDCGVQFVLVERDADQVLGNQIAGRDAPLLHRSAHCGDASFYDAERLRRGTIILPMQNQNEGDGSQGE